MEKIGYLGNDTWKQFLAHPPPTYITGKKSNIQSAKRKKEWKTPKKTFLGGARLLLSLRRADAPPVNGARLLLSLHRAAAPLVNGARLNGLRRHCASPLRRAPLKREERGAGELAEI